MPLPLWSRIRLAPRIALMIMLTLAASAGLEWILRGVVPGIVVLSVERSWLIGAIGTARDAALTIAVSQRAAALQDAPGSDFLSFAVADAPVAATETLSPPFAALCADVAAALKLPPEDVVLSARSTFSLWRSVTPVTVLYDHMPSVMLRPTSYEDNKWVFGDLTVSVRLTADSWMVVVPKNDGFEWQRVIRNLVYPIGNLLLIGGLSLWMARGITRPLSDLADAAERLGRERQPTLLAEFGVPELNAIASSLNEMQVRLKRFVDDRLHMLAAISHDLRTPLTRLRLFAEYLDDSEQQRQVLSDIQAMEEMISSTLTFASSQLQNEKRVAVDLASLLISVCDTAADAGFQISYGGPDHAYASCQPVAIRRAMVNLVDNACKYASSVTVTLHAGIDAMTVVVADDGPGIPAEQTEQAFQPFVRLESSRNRETGGTGLGLAIAREVVQTHGGSITLSAAHPSGLVVTVTLPKSAG